MGLRKQALFQLLSSALLKGLGLGLGLEVRVNVRIWFVVRVALIATAEIWADWDDSHSHARAAKYGYPCFAVRNKDEC